jgi:signal transduction histidine kinase
MSHASDRAATLRGVLVSDRLDPLVGQACVLVPVAVDLLFRLVVLQDVIHERASVLAILVLLSATLVAAFLRHGRLAAHGVAVIASLDILGLGVLSLAPHSGVGAAIAFPAAWLGAQFRFRGVWVAISSTVVAVVLRSLVWHDASTDVLARSLQLVLLSAFCSVVLAGMREMWLQQYVDARSSGRRLEHAMNELVQHRRLNEAIVTTVDVGLVSLDAEGRYTSVNPRHQQFMDLAYPAGHSGRAGQLGFVFAEDRSTLLGHEEMPTLRATRGEEFDDVRIWVGELPGERRALSVAARSVRDEDGHFAGSVLSYKDVTDLLHAMRVKEEFVTQVSHELRTPLTSIVGYVDVLVEDIDGLPDEALLHLAAVQRNSARLRVLVDDLLLTASHGEGLQLEVDAVDVAALVSEVIEMNRAAAAERNQDLTLVLGGRPSVQGDRAQLSGVVTNLVSNALKCSPEGSPVRIEVGQSDGLVSVRVCDRGIGIDEADLDHVFTKFFRTRESQERAIQGIGLGLAIAKAIVDAHGGRLTVASSPGLGSTFEMSLPGGAVENRSRRSA